MTLHPDKAEPIRMEYYTGKLFTGQSIRGNDRSYDTLKGTYQISLLVNGRLFADEEFVHEFEYYDEVRKTRLGGLTRIITLELSKLEQFLGKSTEEMSGKERWGIFFKYCTDKRKRVLINELLRSEEGIAMAGEELLTISRDEHEQARQLSKLKYELDMQSRVVTAKWEGHAEGRTEGERIGQERARQEILDLLKSGIPADEILHRYSSK